jgi:hypothetical protein
VLVISEANSSSSFSIDSLALIRVLDTFARRLISFKEYQAPIAPRTRTTIRKDRGISIQTTSETTNK